MRITVDLLTQMGCKDRILYNNSTYQREYFFKMHGYEFVFEESKESSGVWTFTAGGYKHMVTDIEECFGMLASDFIEIGTKQFKKELKAMLTP